MIAIDAEINSRVTDSATACVNDTVNDVIRLKLLKSDGEKGLRSDNFMNGVWAGGPGCTNRCYEAPPYRRMRGYNDRNMNSNQTIIYMNNVDLLSSILIP